MRRMQICAEHCAIVLARCTILQMCSKWREVAMLGRCGFQGRMPGGTYFLYAKSPQGLANGMKFANAEAASQYLINDHSIVTVPWDDAGPFLRFSVTYEGATEAAEDALMAETETRLKQIQPVF